MTLWLVRSGTGKQAQGRVNIDVEPCPCIMAGGLGGGNTSQYWIEDDDKMSSLKEVGKPPYKVPSMQEINAIPWNGFRVASTFSGCGGSCLGYRMAGFKVVWANEFVPSAQASYKANAASDCYLDIRDIRAVNPGDILGQTGLKVGELDLFDGSPPCQAFSTAGKREKGWGKDKIYEHGAKQKNETLFFEYIRLLDGLQPKVFVAENVSGLVKGTAKGYFIEILKEMKAIGYNVKAQLLDAQWLGVPQMRQRIIFVGVRNDIGMEPVFPKPLAYRYSVGDALPWVCSDKQDFKAEVIVGNDKFESRWGPPDSPSTTVTTGATKQNGWTKQGIKKRKFTIQELKRICAFPDDFVLLGSYAQQWVRLGNSVPPVMMFHIASIIRDKMLIKATPEQESTHAP